jgi:hypothetical protein
MAGRRLRTVGDYLRAERYVLPAGRGCRSLPGAARRILPTRQEVYWSVRAVTIASSPTASQAGDFNDGDIYYGFPNLESRGFRSPTPARARVDDTSRDDRHVSGPPA